MRFFCPFIWAHVGPLRPGTLFCDQKVGVVRYFTNINVSPNLLHRDKNTNKRGLIFNFCDFIVFCYCETPMLIIRKCFHVFWKSLLGNVIMTVAM